MSTTKILAITAGTILTIGTAYAIYFDYKRRTDPEFRRQIRRGRRQVEKKREKEKKDQQEASKKDYKKAWLEIKDQDYPTRPDEMEQFFLAQISDAERLLGQGPAMYLTAAQYFYRALKVYPNTAELLDIYKKTVPETAYITIMGIKEAAEADLYPPADNDQD